MGNYNRKLFTEALRSSGLCRGDLVFSHSNIAFFGLPEEGRNADVAVQVIMNAFFDVIGDGGTLIVPTFTYSFPDGKIFDVQNSSGNGGVFAEAIRNHKDSYRSIDPSVSVAAIGSDAKSLTENMPVNSYGPGSFFERFYSAGGKICNLNFDAGSTFIHFVERQLNVSYRFDKKFTGIIRNAGREYEVAHELYVRYLHPDTEAVFEPFDRCAQELKVCNKVSVGRGAITVLTAEGTYSLVDRMLKKKPYFLTKAGQSDRTPELDLYAELPTY